MSPLVFFFSLAGFSVAGFICGLLCAWRELRLDEADTARRAFDAGFQAGAAETLRAAHRARVDAERMVIHSRN